MSDEVKKPVRVPSALKRQNQSIERNQRNRAFKSQVNTALRSFKEAAAKKEPMAMKEKLSLVYSLMDKGVKKGIYKMNKAGRVKARLTASVQ